MLSLPPQLRVFLCTRPTDMRKSFDGLLALAQEHLARDVLQGGLFVFVSRRRDRLHSRFDEAIRDALLVTFPIVMPAELAHGVAQRWVAERIMQSRHSDFRLLQNRST